MRKYLSFIAALLVSVSTLSFAQETAMDTESVEYKITQAAVNAETTADAVALLLSDESDILSDAQKVALNSLPEEAQAFFIETIIGGEIATDAALVTASTQPGITTDMGTDLYNAFAPQLADIDDEDNQGNLFQTAAAGNATGPIGFGAGAGGGGGGGAAASGN